MAFKIKKKPENSGRNQKKKKNTVKGNGGKVVRNVFLVLAGVLVIGGTAFGVHEWKNIKDVAERTSFDSDEAGRINGESVSMAEFMVYSMHLHNCTICFIWHRQPLRNDMRKILVPVLHLSYCCTICEEILYAYRFRRY